MKSNIVGTIIGLPRPIKRAAMIATDLLIVPIALWAAVAVRSDSLSASTGIRPWMYVMVATTTAAVFAALGFYRSVVRLIGHQAVLIIVAGAAASTFLLWSSATALSAGVVPVGVAINFGMLTILFVGATRYLARWILTPFDQAGIRVVIYGAGEAGARLALALSAGSQYLPVAYVDEKRALHGAIVNGMPVVAPAELPGFLEEFAVKRILLAIPSASKARKAQVLADISKLGVYVQSVPELDDIVHGRARVDELRDLDVADLLGRDPVPPDRALLDACIRGKSVMVTGAGGSIGAELCRQIIRLQPRTLILFEFSEVALYNIERELSAAVQREGLEVMLHALLANAHDRIRVGEILRAFKVQTIYHAAAYKHVPIVEQNIIEGIHNNVFSTWHAAEAAIEAGVETFVLISTDKAVNPTNVMGATKRLAEIVLQALQSRTTTTKMCMVRFGNVLASSGSVVPLFQEQIRAGGPITVTHPEVKRYFMTIAEAAQLVLQAGCMARGGDVFVLDMGQPVKIDDLARRMLALAGLTVRDIGQPDGDIEIQYIGLRPAEKLFEELLIGTQVAGTDHPKVLRAIEPCGTWEEIGELLAAFSAAMDRSDCAEVLELLERAVKEYKRAPEIHDVAWGQRAASIATDAGSNVTSLPARRARPNPPKAG